MSDFQAPSFSLGLDFTLDSDSQTCKPAPQPPNSINDGDFESAVVYPVSNNQSFHPHPPLKRRRRGPTLDPALVRQNPDDLNLDILVADKPRHCSSEFSISKIPLPRHGNFIEQSVSNINQNTSTAPASANTRTSSKNHAYPNSRDSFSRNFELIDSDLDEPLGTTTNKRQNTRDSSSRMFELIDSDLDEPLGTTNKGQNTRDSPSRKFVLIDSDVDESLGTTNKRQNKSVQKIKIFEQQLNLGCKVPHSHRYYFHVDQRIQNLVQNRLPNFLPLGAINSTQPITSDINYMTQFCHGDGNNKSSISSEKKQSHSRKSNLEEVSEGSGTWVNPKDSALTPKKAVKRKASTVGESSGHWYMASNGKRVYISKKGQELTGRIAYRNYKKEKASGSNRSKTKGGVGSKRAKKKNGAGSKRSKKKTGAKKK